MFFPTKLPLGTALLLAACSSSPRHSVIPLESIGEFTELELTYEASASAECWDSAVLDFEPAGDLEGVESFVRVETRTAVLTKDQVNALLGSERHGVWSVKADGLAAQSWLDRVRDTTNQQEQAITMAPGQECYTTTINQAAYVESFAITCSPKALMADPVVGVANEGLVVSVTGHLQTTGDGVQVEAALERHDLAKPIATLDVMIPGVVEPVTIQRPVTTHQRIEIQSDLAPGDAIVTAIPRAGDPVRLDVVVLTARTVPRKR